MARPSLSGDETTEWVAFNACLPPIAAFDGQELITAEGLGTADHLHPVQQEIAVRGGSQCGYCTPGFVCSMAAEYYRADRQSTYAASRVDGTSAGADGHGEADAEHGANGFDLHALSGNLCRCTGYRPIKDAAYALENPAVDDVLAQRRERPAPPPRATTLRMGESEFVRPATWDEALRLVADRPDAVVVAGCTDWGVEV